MKHAKKWLALLLTLALALTLALPAFAEDDPPEEPNPAMPVITRQPEGGIIRFGSSVPISVEAHIPNGDEIGYLWHFNYSNGNVGSWCGDDAEVEMQYYEVAVCVEVFNKASPEYRVTSETVYVEKALIDKIAQAMEPVTDFLFYKMPNAITNAITIILLLPFLPFIFLFGTLPGWMLIGYTLAPFLEIIRWIINLFR